VSLLNARFPGPVLALLRFSTGALLASYHGWGKIYAAYAHFATGSEWPFIRFVATLGLPAPTFFALAASLTEFLGGILVAIGLFTRAAALSIVVEMSVALYYHFTTGSGFELAALYFTLNLAFLFGSPTSFSLDDKIGSLRKKG
jgi:putative oxidoreductase